jgi:murein DD-endopeptidase MepM/ murein hydrolase activator NlpD
MNQFVPGLVEGTPVVAGQIIGYVGTSGRSYGYHLHFEVKVNGTHEDPAAFMRSVNLEF